MKIRLRKTIFSVIQKEGFQPLVLMSLLFPRRIIFVRVILVAQAFLLPPMLAHFNFITVIVFVIVKLKRGQEC